MSTESKNLIAPGSVVSLPYTTAPRTASITIGYSDVVALQMLHSSALRAQYLYKVYGLVPHEAIQILLQLVESGNIGTYPEWSP